MSYDTDDEVPPIVKFLFLGSPGCGKTTFAHRFSNGNWIERPKPTVGADFLTRTSFAVDGRKWTMQVWDMQGTDHNTVLVANSVSNASFALVFVDATRLESTCTVAVEWQRNFHAACAKRGMKIMPPCVLVVAKCDLLKYWKHTTSEQQQQQKPPPVADVVETSAPSKRKKKHRLLARDKEVKPEIAPVATAPPPPVVQSDEEVQKERDDWIDDFVRSNSFDGWIRCSSRHNVNIQEAVVMGMRLALKTGAYEAAQTTVKRDSVLLEKSLVAQATHDAPKPMKKCCV